MTHKQLIEAMATAFRRAATDRLMDEDGCPEGAQITAGCEAALAVVREALRAEREDERRPYRRAEPLTEARIASLTEWAKAHYETTCLSGAAFLDVLTELATARAELAKLNRTTLAASPLYKETT